MEEIEFTKEQKDAIVAKIKEYFESELDQEIGQFDAEFLLGFFTGEIGPYFYNKGLFDARVVLQTYLDNIDEGLYGLEKPTEK
ncbi:MAG: DUF2164 domain-containing protein [Acidobacteriota bacterium]|nr:DUF2164 domain-containing protein [Acidobacteriota bacterium]